MYSGSNFKKEYHEIENRVVNTINNICRIMETNYKEIADVLETDQAYIHKALSRKKHLTFPLFLKICYALKEINKNKNFPYPDEELLPSRILSKAGV
ncbi:MAG: hypothetical protein C0175_03480 [Caldisericum exile]|uniref:Uncharacterized protein n=1 Tax=Caldisericum exile TaxID=693075 RepID=A0A2J6X6P0_9BACT|nr:MAG: hypothetical protein C0175_03480 [Caldisericum exile]